MKTASRFMTAAIATLALGAASAYAQDPAHATELRMAHPGPGPDGKDRISFLAHRLGSDHAEALSMIDMNGDGFVDLTSGAYWYENPGANGGEWKRHQFRSVGIHNEFVSDCGEWAIDVDHDGLVDVVTTGWISNGLWWFKNPGPKATAAGTQWVGMKIADSFDTEGGAFADINGDGKPDVALAHYNRSGVMWADFGKGTPKVHHVGGKAEDGHGIGIADINGDGKPDLLTTHGWFEQVDADNDKWKWHGDWDLGDAGFPILGYDVNHDGKLDLIYGQGHGYGLYWLEQAGTTASPKWVRHNIDESFSQSHALALVDLDGDGVPELVTGKRYRGHGGGDPGSYDPNVIYAYRLPGADQISATKAHAGDPMGASGPGWPSAMVLSAATADPMWFRETLSLNGTATIGTQVVYGDFDHDGDIDIATAGKLGVHVLENLKVVKVPDDVREATQPLNKEWPFPGEGKDVPQEDGPTPQ
jgi:hypothetical protein